MVGVGGGGVSNKCLSVWLDSFLSQGYHRCLETGSYLLNYAACAQCGERDLEIRNHIVSVTEDEDELITLSTYVCYLLG